uniref:Immunoglobulin-like beta-sandwich domain-containing protein n=1 Tax=Seriola lalandi dorsalis TaxID=1841481 RepID=A0A3B4YJ65_SERLL
MVRGFVIVKITAWSRLGADCGHSQKPTLTVGMKCGVNSGLPFAAYIYLQCQCDTQKKRLEDGDRRDIQLMSRLRNGGGGGGGGGPSVSLCSHVCWFSSLSPLVLTDLLAQPSISLSPSADGDSKQWAFRVLMGSDFTITCSTEPQYQEGSFQLIFSPAHREHNHTLPAVNHSARFLFTAADHTHQGSYRCVYHVHVFSHNFSSESRPLSLTVSGNFMDSLCQTGKFLCNLIQSMSCYVLLRLVSSYWCLSKNKIIK